MGMHWESALVVGFVIERDDLEMPFKQDVPAQTHLEDRFDSKTGKSLGQVTVVDKEARTEFFLNGESLGDSYDDLIDALGREIKCSIMLHGDYCSGEDMVYSIEPLQARPVMTLKEVSDLQDECESIRHAFQSRYGIDLGESHVTTVMTYS